MQARTSLSPPSAPRHPLVALRISDSVAAALEIARERAVHHFAVRHRGRVVGMVCACDLEQAGGDRLVGEVMHPAVMLPDARSATEAAMLMQAARVGSILLTDPSGEPSGVVTRADLGDEPSLGTFFDDYRCVACGEIHHLHQRGDRRPCFSCRQRAMGLRPRAASSTGELSMRGE